MRRKFLAFLLPIILCATFTLGGTVAYAAGENNVAADAAGLFSILIGENQIEENEVYTVFDYKLWEPGCVRYERFCMKKGDAGDFTYKLTMELPENGQLEELAEVMDVYVFPFSQLDGRKSLTAENCLGSVDALLKDGVGVLCEGDSAGIDQQGDVFDVVIAFKMRESAGNEYQGKLLCDSGFTLTLSASQLADS